MIDEGPGDSELAGEGFRDGAHAESFGGVVAAVEEVDAEFGVDLKTRIVDLMLGTFASFTLIVTAVALARAWGWL